MTHPIINIASKAAIQAGRTIRRAFDNIDKVEIQSKGQNNFVTEIDKKSEREICHVLQKSYPDYGIIAEESGQYGPQDNVWIIDPLDGTTNFIHNLPHFSVSIALKQNDIIEHGVIYDPMRDELFTASRGQGAQLNGRRIRVSKRPSLEGALVGTGLMFGRDYNIATLLKLAKTFYPQVAGYRRAGSATLDLAYVAAGRLDAFWESSLQPWDVAAGSLIVREAGGLVTDLNGEDNFLNSGDILVANPKLFQQVLSILQ